MPAGLVMSELPWEAASLTVSGISPLGKKQKSARGGPYCAKNTLL